ncbi:MAG: zinc-finger domain-containing protein [Ferrovum sp. 37-45-19]|jgi:uncharacterized Zn-finger protein|uniref:zinc-finger domain-containing protein n=1 Tax=Ferrovum sp. JA12 TaxID=1356299 RepID=UPI0007035BA9|nr:zinc-finger domain-containing protein [Ferrovum sp. JA12]OYV80185.1 MAG: zinc-finger domain-containing protein [Ferrovum sp. 21-44-67]OYV94462.1 MAG: zinc-finger domain-containing protein [Ferrovum sp. 37-45-19]OZB32444.1 MAG: zinc-finger domain-containing protein [Ferrovum sp. 34-44-207]HQT81640.1 zinc-finger domain-containing protein [Ferrovaceae bacterium]KRH78865.1 zinc-finger domain protein [Ferrovum sp. JA12]
MSQGKALDQQVVVVSEKDLPLHCPQPAVAIWNTHPRVFLDITKTGHAQCPYCGTKYEWQGPLPQAQH